MESKLTTLWLEIRELRGKPGGSRQQSKQQHCVPICLHCPSVCLRILCITSQCPRPQASQENNLYILNVKKQEGEECECMLNPLPYFMKQSKVILDKFDSVWKCGLRYHFEKDKGNFLLNVVKTYWVSFTGENKNKYNTCGSKEIGKHNKI